MEIEVILCFFPLLIVYNEQQSNRQSHLPQSHP